MFLFDWLIDRKRTGIRREARKRLDESGLRDGLGVLIRTPEFERLFERLARERQARSSRNLGVVSLESGEGKTLVASLIAFACADILSETVLIVDSQTVSNPGSLRLESIFETEDGPPRADGTRGTFHLRVDLMKLSELQSQSPVDIAFQIDALVDSFVDKYDTIILDTGSSGGTRSFDPIVLANRIHSTVLVTTLKSMGSAKAKRWSAERLIGSDRLAGVVWNEGGF